MTGPKRPHRKVTPAIEDPIHAVKVKDVLVSRGLYGAWFACSRLLVHEMWRGVCMQRSVDLLLGNNWTQSAGIQSTGKFRNGHWWTVTNVGAWFNCWNLIKSNLFPSRYLDEVMRKTRLDCFSCQSTGSAWQPVKFLQISASIHNTGLISLPGKPEDGRHPERQ